MSHTKELPPFVSAEQVVPKGELWINAPAEDEPASVIVVYKPGQWYPKTRISGGHSVFKGPAYKLCFGDSVRFWHNGKYHRFENRNGKLYKNGRRIFFRQEWREWIDA